MSNEETKIPLGYAEATYFVCINIEGAVIAVPKNRLDRPFVEVLMEAKSLRYEKIEGEYFRVIGSQNPDIEIKTDKKMLHYHGLPCASTEIVPDKQVL